MSNETGLYLATSCIYKNWYQPAKVSPPLCDSCAPKLYACHMIYKLYFMYASKNVTHKEAHKSIKCNFPTLIRVKKYFWILW